MVVAQHTPGSWTLDEDEGFAHGGAVPIARAYDADDFPCSEDFWGPEIVVDGVRPDWLADQEPFVWVKTHSWLEHFKAPLSYEWPHARSTQGWCWSHRDGDPCIRSIRLPATHPAYLSRES